MKTNRPTTNRILSRRITALALSLWFVAMSILTWAMAEDMYRQIETSAFDYATRLSHRSIIHTDKTDGLAGDAESEMLAHLTMPYYFLKPEQFLPITLPPTPSSMGSDDWYWGKWKLIYGFEIAGIFSDEKKETVIQSGNYLKFDYTDETHWNNQSAQILGASYINIDVLGRETDALDSFFPPHDPTYPSLLWYALPVLRLTGYFEANEFIPVQIDRVEKIFSSPNTYHVEEFIELDSQKQMRWRTLLTADAPSDQELSTLYAWNVEAVTAEYDPITVNDTHFDSLVALLATTHTTGTVFNTKNLLESIITVQASFLDASGNTYHYGLGVRCWPLGYALFRLIPVYLVSLTLILLVLRRMLNKIREQLVYPLEYMVSCIEKDWSLSPSSSLEELHRIEGYYSDSYHTQAKMRNEISQLKAALSFAHNAEENRRQLISNITHELKTPLAIIHSYTEGLQAGIAEGKQEQYIAVIQEETQRMDAMVLQMLDLSRLEAGKVKLSADQLKLTELTKSTLETFSPLFREKEIHLTLGLMEDLTVIADESRIRQVVTNLLSNARKYTPVGGNITINIYRQNHSVLFSVINTADHLSNEALSRVWDSFYRVDSSRTEPGTGLGLTLVKQIVELHQGTCYVKNTMDKQTDPHRQAVEFGFLIPIR